MGGWLGGWADEEAGEWGWMDVCVGGGRARLGECISACACATVPWVLYRGLSSQYALWLT